MCGFNQFFVVDRYTYLGVVLHENLDMNITVKAVAHSASRALGLLIAKCKYVGGLPYHVFSKLYDSVVWTVISYSAPLWGYRSYSCIDAVQHRAIRFFLGVGKYSPNDGISGEMAWKPPIVRQWKSVSLFWARLACMHGSRFNKRVALWAHGESSRSCKNWIYNVTSYFIENDMNMYCNLEIPIPRSFAVNIEEITHECYINSWLRRINNDIGPSGRGRNKLRLYKLFKSSYNVEEYCTLTLPLSHRSAFSKFRLGVAPIRIETGRYEGLIEENRTCPFCLSKNVENELHVILECQIYNDLRDSLLSKAIVCNSEFPNLSKIDQFTMLFSNKDLIRQCAKTCHAILKRRQFLLCK